MTAGPKCPTLAYMTIKNEKIRLRVASELLRKLKRNHANLRRRTGCDITFSESLRRILEKGASPK